MNHDVDKKLSNSFKKMTDDSEDLIPLIWEQLESKIDFENQTLKDKNDEKTINFSSKDPKKTFFTHYRTAVAAVALIVMSVFATADEGKAFFSNIFKYFDSTITQDFFNPTTEKTEKITAKIFKNDKNKYLLFFDTDYFDVESSSDSDKFTVKKDPSNSFLQVSLVKNKTTEEVVNELNQTTAKKYDKVEKTSQFSFWNYSNSTVIQGTKGESLRSIHIIHNVKELGTYVINLNYDEKDVATLNRLFKMLEAFRILDSNTLSSVEKGSSILFVDYNKAKYDLVKIKGESYIHVVDKETHTTFIASYRHLPTKNIETAVDDHIKFIDSYDPGSATKVQSDLEINSTKLTNKTSLHEIYFIDDGQGGCYELLISSPGNPNAFNEADRTNFLKSLKVFPKEGNENLMDIKELENMYKG